MGSNFPDHYVTLGVQRTATQREIAVAYRKFMPTHNPDVGSAATDRSELLRIMEASAVLRDPAKRAAYDKELAPFLDPEACEQPLPRAQRISLTGAALAVVPIWSEDDRQHRSFGVQHRSFGVQHRSFGVFYLPPAGDIWMLRPEYTGYLEPADTESEHLVSLRNDAFKRAIARAKDFLFGPEATHY